jgi:hypothetical protein
MTTALPSQDEAPAWLPTGEIPVQRTAPPDFLRPEPALPAVPQRVWPTRAKPARRRWPAALGGLAAGLAVGTAGALAAVSATSATGPAPAAPRSPTPSVSVPGRTLTAFGDGTWQIGVDVAPGAYSTAGPAGADCYHALRKTATGGDVAGGAVSRGPATVVLADGDGWFETFGCATWNRVG